MSRHTTLRRIGFTLAVCTALTLSVVTATTAHRNSLDPDGVAVAADHRNSLDPNGVAVATADPTATVGRA